MSCFSYVPLFEPSPDSTFLFARDVQEISQAKNQLRDQGVSVD